MLQNKLHDKLPFLLHFLLTQASVKEAPAIIWKQISQLYPFSDCPFFLYLVNIFSILSDNRLFPRVNIRSVNLDPKLYFQVLYHGFPQ